MSTAFNMAHDNDRIGMCLNITKFSHATAASNLAPSAWTHLTAADIYVFVDGPQSLTPMCLKVLHRNSCIEQVELSDLIDATINKRRAEAQAQIAPHIDQHSIYAIARDLRLALRYHLPDGCQRRIQFSMKSPSDTEQLVSLFKRRGMVFQEQRSGKAIVQVQNTNLATQSSVNDWQTLPSPAISQATHVESRQPARTGIVQPPAIGIGDPFGQNLNAPQAGGSASIRVPSSLIVATRQMDPPSTPHASSELTKRDAALTGPVMSQIYRSNTTLHQPIGDKPDVRTTSEGFAQHNHETVPANGFVRHSISTNQTQWQHVDTPSLAMSQLRHAADASEQRGPESSSAKLATSSSSYFSFPGTLEHEVPPRRELPFDKRPSSSRQSGSDRSGSRPGTAAVSPSKKSGSSATGPSFPSSPPTRVSEAVAEPVRPKTASAPKRTAITAFGSAERPKTAIPPKPALEHAEFVKPSPLLKRPVEKQPPPVKNKPIECPPPRMDELLYGRRATMEQPARLGTLTDASHHANQPTLPRIPALPAGSIDPSIRVAAAIPKPTDEHSGDWGRLDAYAAQSLEDRHAALDEFMVHCLENPAFARLCEDVENCWRRVALGL